MIKNPKQYLAEEEQTRLQFLHQLTQEESVHLMEDLLLSGLTEELTFSDRQPTALAISIKNAKKRVHCSLLSGRKTLRILRRLAVGSADLRRNGGPAGV